MSYKKIIKRDGRVVKFDSQRITEALTKAGQATGEFDEKVAQKLTMRVLALSSEIITDEVPTVEQIQDIVEEVLLSSRYKTTAKAYIIYRDQHRALREITDSFSVNQVDNYLNKLDWKVNENSNMAYSLQGLNNYLASEISKTYWLNKIYTPEIREAYLKGEIHVHDLNILSVYCVGWDLYDLLLRGFGGVTGKIESKPPKHLRAALGQVVNFFYTMQGEAAGAQAFSNFDTLLAPFIRYDNLSPTEVKQALQEFVFNINVPTRVGFQTPFTNVTLDLTIPPIYAKQSVLIGGKPQMETYSEFQAEMDLFNKSFMEVMLEGDAKGRVFTFPIPTVNVTRDFPWESDAAKMLCTITAKYGIPYFSNFINSDLDPDDARSMCCRLRLDTRGLTHRGGGLFGANPLTGSIGVVTINLPRIGYEANNKEEYFQILRARMDLAYESLEIKRKILENYTQLGLYPYSRHYLDHIFQQTGTFWQNHFSTIGLIGMNEAALNLIGEGIETPAGAEFAGETLDFMLATLHEYAESSGHNYNLEATPAEGASYGLARKDKQSYPDIISANEGSIGGGSEPFYTNSTQLPVNYSDDMFTVLDHQDGLQTRYTGGTVVHLFSGDRIDDPAIIKDLVTTICENYHLPYFTFTPTFSVCSDHGYLQGEHQECPTCLKVCEVYSRVVGYLRPVAQWNKGKKAEFKHRVLFKVPVVVMNEARRH